MIYVLCWYREAFEVPFKRCTVQDIGIAEVARILASPAFLASSTSYYTSQ